MNEYQRKISVHRGSDVGMHGHGIFSKTNVKYLISTSSESNTGLKKNKKKGRGSPNKLSGSGPVRRNIKRRQGQKPTQSRSSRSKDTLF